LACCPSPATSFALLQATPRSDGIYVGGSHVFCGAGQSTTVGTRWRKKIPSKSGLQVSTNSDNIQAGVSTLGEKNYLDEDDSEIGNIHEESPLTVLYQTLRWMPESAILAFLTFTATQKELKLILDTIAMDTNWQDADGGQYRLDLLLPPANSIVIPTVSLLFAILVGQTIVSFRGRTLCIDSSLNKESKDLEVLAQLVGFCGAPNSRRSRRGENHFFIRSKKQRKTYEIHLSHYE
jgi:hypothetical protein